MRERRCVRAAATAERVGRGAATVRRSVVCPLERQWSSAPAKASSVGQRSGGGLASYRTVMSSSSSLTAGRTTVSGGTSPTRWRAVIACAFGPVKGGSPASIS